MRALLFLLLLFISVQAIGQKRIKLKHANTLFGSVKDGERYDRLIGDVVMVQNATTIYCDSAHFFKNQNRVEAFGHVHITEGDSVDCTSLNLTYEGEKKIAHLRRNVVFVKLGMATLYTDFLDYDRIKNEARYFNGGKLIDTTNTLTSRKGYYDINTNLASFKNNVVGTNPDYTLNSDTLQYNSKTKIVYFKDSTTVKDAEGRTAVYQSGFYDTNKKLSDINSGIMETPSYRIKGDRYFINDFKKFYKARDHVVMTSKEEKMIIYGDESYYDKIKGISKVYGHSYAAKITEDDNDTLFIRADTLVSIDSKDPHKKRLLAYHHVRIFKTDLQGIADSLAYIAPDSTMHFYKDPVLWTQENQMTADSIRMVLHDKKIDKIYLVSNSFVVSQDSLQNFNQIKGRKMTAFFDGRTISRVIVQGNGESIYFALEEKKIKKSKAKKDSTEVKSDSLKANDDEAEVKSDSSVIKSDSTGTRKKPAELKIVETMGMNRIICSNMRINFKLGKVNNISFYVKPDASFIPPHELKEEDKKLKGFVWRQPERPEKEDVVPGFHQKKTTHRKIPQTTGSP
jgi:lipopolysaccharide export system protein LptA